jgi:ankyrin repeat protein
MQFFKTLILVTSLLWSAFALALTSDEQVEFTDALSTGNVKVVQKYIDAGVNLNDKYFAWSALQIAANKGQLEVVKVLVDKGADMNYRHPLTKMTALQLAAFDGYENVVSYLASKGADINLKLKGNVSIVRAMRDMGNKKMESLLLSLGAKDDGCQEEKCF